MSTANAPVAMGPVLRFFALLPIALVVIPFAALAIGHPLPSWLTLFSLLVGLMLVGTPIYIAETDQRAYDEARDSVEYFYKLQYELIAESARRSGRQNFIDRAEKLRTLTYDDVLRDNVIVGSPEAVAKRLKDLQEWICFDGILA